MIFLFALLACSPKHAPVGVAEGVAPGIVVASRPSGVVYEGVFTDEMHAFSLPVAEGWVAVPGPEVGLMRVRLNHVATGTRVEVWAFRVAGSSPISERVALGDFKPRVGRFLCLQRLWSRPACLTTRLDGGCMARFFSARVLLFKLK